MSSAALAVRLIMHEPPFPSSPPDAKGRVQADVPPRRGLVLERPYRDRMFTGLYVLASTVVLVSGVAITITTKVGAALFGAAWVAREAR
jgi:hypothetical protein